MNVAVIPLMKPYLRIALFAALALFFGCKAEKKMSDAETVSLSVALAYAGDDSPMFALEQQLVGDLTSIYKEAGLPDSDFLDDLAFTYTHIHIEDRGIGNSSPPVTTLWAKHVNKDTRAIEDENEGSFTAMTTLVSTLPTLDQLKSFERLEQFVELLGPQRGFHDGWSHGWMIFKPTGESEVAVMSIFLNHGLGNTTAPLGLSVETGIFRGDVDPDAG